jgi:HSP20 family molecular chaperone IbpA
MASSRFLSSFRSFMAAMPRRLLPRPIGAYLTKAPEKKDEIDNTFGRPLSKFDLLHPTRMWNQVFNKMVGPYIFRFVERVCGMRESDDSVVFRVYMFGLDKEDIKLHVNNKTFTIEEIDTVFSAWFDLAGKHYDIQNTRAVMKKSVLKVVIPKLKKEEEEKKEDETIHVNIE